MSGLKETLNFMKNLDYLLKESNFQSPNCVKHHDPASDSNVQQQGQPSHHRCSGLNRPRHRKEILPHSRALVNRRKCVQRGRRNQTAQPLP